MRIGLAAAALAVVAVAACQPGSPGAPPTASPAPVRSPLVEPSPPHLRPPAAAVLADGEVGLPRVAGADHLPYTQASRDAPDEVAALQEFAAWGWLEASTRSWAAGTRSVEETLLLTLRALGARRAYDFWAGDADRAPFSGQPCPPSIKGLDDCRLGTAAGRSLVVGRLDAAVFRISGSGLDLAALAAVQAGRLT